MASQLRSSKRLFSQRDPDDEPCNTRSQSSRPLPTSTRQSTLPFSLPASQSTLQSTPQPREQSPTSSINPSESISHTGKHSKSIGYRIAASQRIYFDAGDVSKLQLGEGEYRIRARTTRGVGKSKISWIWLHGVELERKCQGAWTERYWLCKHCFDSGDPKALAVSATSSCIMHLYQKHKILPPGSISSESTSAITSFVEIQQYPQQVPLQAERWCNHYINWIAATDTTFEEAANPFLREVIINGGPHAKGLLPSRKTVRSWLLNTYYERLDEVKEQLANSRSCITLSLDGWSTPNDISMLGVVGHWINEQCELKTALLALRPLDSHSGKAIADTLSTVITTYELEGKIGAFQMDNASNNDTTLEALSSALPSLNLSMTDMVPMRLRCFGHIVNLVVKALLFGTNTSAFEDDLQHANEHQSFALWRKHGAIGHLHNIVTYITRSDQRMRAFEAVQLAIAPNERPLHLVKDIGIRWNSTFAMIQRALRLELAIDRYCRQWRPTTGEGYSLKKDILDQQDWEELRHFEELLQPFNRATKRVEGNAVTGTHGALWEVLPTMDYLFNTLKERADEVEQDQQRDTGIFTDYFSHCLNHGFAKLREYYTKVDTSPFYAAAVALHPCKKFNYFEQQWTTKDAEKDIKKAKQSVRRLFSDYIERQRDIEAASPPPVILDNHEDKHWAAAFGDHTAAASKDKGRRNTELQRFMDDELDTYYTTRINGKMVKCSYLNEPLRWWRDKGQVAYPTLAIMAFDLFAMPGMSSECERAFSAAKHMITDHRYSLKSDIIQADQCLKSWLKNGITNGTTTLAAAAIAIDDDSDNDAE